MKHFCYPRRGSVITLAMIFSAVTILAITYLSQSILTQHKTTMRYGLGQSAFHLAESGIERAIYAITEEQLGGSQWPSNGLQSWLYTESDEPVGKHAATTKVQVVNNGGGQYTITAKSSIKLGDELVERAVQIVAKQSVTEEQITEQTGSGIFAYGLVARDGIKLNHNNPGMRIASYDSNVNFGVPNFGVNTGYETVVGTPSANNYAININNAYIHGAVRSGGGSIGYNSGFNNPSQQGQNATVKGPDSTNSYGVDQNRMSTDFDVEIPDPVLPEKVGYNQVNISDQNYWQNNREVYLGSWNVPTWVDTPTMSNNQNSKIHVIGDVVIDVQRNFNVGGDIIIEPGAKLTIMAGENMHLNANYVQQQHPDQFHLIAKNSQDVVINSFKVISAVIDAPKSNVRLAGVGGSPKSQFRGAIVAKFIEVTNGAEFYYDINLGDGGSDSGEVVVDAGGVVGALELISWAQIPASKVNI